MTCEHKQPCGIRHCVEVRDLRAQLAAEKAEHAKTWRLLDDEREHVEECESRCAAEKARAEKAEAERERNARMLMDVQGDKHVVHDEKYHEHVEMWQERAYNAERSRDELGIQLAAQSERLRLATHVADNARTLVAMWMQNTPQLSHYMLDLNASLRALDAVPGDALAPRITAALEASGIDASNVKGVG